MSDPVTNTNTVSNTNTNRGIENLYKNYLSSRQGEVEQCIKTYNDLLINDNGSEFSRVFLDPLYTQLKGKVCNPATFSKYIQNLVDYPDTIARIDQRLYNIGQRLNSINATGSESESGQNNNSNIGIFRKDTLAIFITMIVFFVIVIILYVIIMAKK